MKNSKKNNGFPRNRPKNSSTKQNQIIKKEIIIKDGKKYLKTTKVNKNNFKLSKIFFLNLALIIGIGSIGYQLININSESLSNPSYINEHLPKKRLFGGSSGSNINFDFNSLINSQKIQDAMRGAPGNMVVIDEDGNVMAGIGVDDLSLPASTLKLATTALIVEKFDINSKPKEFGGESLKEVLLFANTYSHNGKMEQLVEYAGGYKELEKYVRKITGDNRTTIGNGSGYNGGLVGSGKSSGITVNPKRPENRISVKSMALVVRHLDKMLINKGHNLKDITSPGSQEKFGTASKTGSLPNTGYSCLAGRIYDARGKVYYFAVFNYIKNGYSRGDNNHNLAVRSQKKVIDSVKKPKS
jgi:hypothetical protein